MIGVCASACVPRATRAQPDAGNAAIRLRLVSDEADAVLDILARSAGGAAPDERQWSTLFSTEGYRRLAERERSLGRPFDDAAFRAFVMQPELGAQRERLAAALAAWSHADVRVCGQRALAYLPAGSRLHASVYPEIKPLPNSFVYDLAHDPGIFLNRILPSAQPNSRTPSRTSCTTWDSRKTARPPPCAPSSHGCRRRCSDSSAGSAGSAKDSRCSRERAVRTSIRGPS